MHAQSKPLRLPFGVFEKNASAFMRKTRTEDAQLKVLRCSLQVPVLEKAG